MDTNKELTAFLRADVAIAALVGDRVHANYVPQEEAGQFPRIWFSRSGTDYGECIGGDEEPWKEDYDLEIFTRDPGQMYAEPGGLMKLVRDRLHDHNGAFGGGQVSLIEVNDHSDDYVPRGHGLATPEELLNAGLFIESFDISIYPAGA